ncbi:MAG: hypothetical protein QNJ09_02850 [Paracoccaceae bacterium]|nr:hypothetical protein [Paracoccaceae bacterium]
MTDINELQARIARALDRIATGVEGFEPGGGADEVLDDITGEPDGASGTAAADAEEEAQRLRVLLEDERLAYAQLEERLKTLRDRQDGASAELREQVSAQREGLAQLDSELQRLRKANQMLRESNDALREANAAGVGEPHLINKAMLAELESIRAERSSEAAETRVVLAALEPLLAEAARGGAEADAQEEAG